MLNSTLSDKGPFRIKDWWRSKAALLMGMVYIFTAWFDIAFEKFLFLALLSIATISGFASLGYLINDFFDREKDAKVGKKNFLSGKAPLIILIFFTGALLLLLFPWKYLPSDNFSLALIAFEIFLFIAYSFPPFRLKEKGLSGLIVDALYAHGIPVLLAAYTFSLASGKSIPLIPALLLLFWQIISGLRNILVHQAKDVAHDIHSGTLNFVAGMYPSNFYALIKNFILIELFFSIIFFGVLAPDHLFPWLCISTIIFFSLFVLLFLWDKDVSYMLSSRWRNFPNNVFEQWIPPVTLFALALVNLRFAWVLFFHLVLFNFDFFIQLRNHGIPLLVRAMYALLSRLITALYRVRGAFYIAISFLINNSIYYTFLIFGVDLKKENSSAIGYFKRKRRELKD